MRVINRNPHAWIFSLFIVLFMSGPAAFAAEKLSPEEYFLKAKELYDQKKYEEAISDYTEAIKLNASFVEAYYGRGAAYGMTGAEELAIKDFDKVIEIDPNDAQAYYNKGVVYEIFFKFEEAIEQLELYLKHTNFQTPQEQVDLAKMKLDKLKRKIEKEKQLQKKAEREERLKKMNR